jgi:GGDEF domain-containing protein
MMSTINDIVLIEPRSGVSAQEIAEFLREKFQQPETIDNGNNPLVNASIKVLEDHHR